MNLNFRDFKVLLDRDKDQERNIEKVIIEPLDKGFGLTLGTSMRRVLMRSMPGSAPAGFKIEGVNNTFMMIPGTSTDTLELISSLKKMRVVVPSKKDVVLKFKAKKSGTYTFADLNIPDDVKVLDKNVPLLDLTGEKEVELEILVRTFRGNIESSEQTDIPKGFLPVDSNYSPIIKVGYEVNPLMEDEVVTHETLTLSIETNGTISAEEAVHQASRILTEHYLRFDTMEVKKSEVEIFEEKEKVRKSIDNITIEELELSVRSTNALKNADIKNVGDLRALTEIELRDLRNMGKRSVDEVIDVLKKLDVQLGDY